MHLQSVKYHRFGSFSPLHHAGLLLSRSSLSSSQFLRDLVRESLWSLRPPAELQRPRLGLQRQRLPIVAAAQRAAPGGLAGGPVVRGGVPERGAVLRARLVPLHQHQRGLQRVRVTRLMMPHILLDAPVAFDRLFWRVGTLTFILLLCLQAGPPVRRSGLRDEPPSPGLLGGASGVRPSAGPAAVQLRRLQHQIPAPLSLQGLSERPGGAVQGLLMTSRGPAVGDALPRVSLETAAGM